MTEKYLLDVIIAGLQGDSTKVELAALTLSRDLKKKDPRMSAKILDILSDYSFFGNTRLRSAKVAPPPIDKDSQLEMATIITPDLLQHEQPILSVSIQAATDRFIDERNHGDLLLKEGLRPSNSLLLTGPPGTGKTMLAKYFASALNKNLVMLDLSASISSLLGKTGANIKRVLDYAKATSSVLLLDEFDAIAKRRDDITDLGEIKRVVNILLMEMENWPISSVLIATSNHPELLDKAVWRRFDHIFPMALPNYDQRLRILKAQFPHIDLAKHNTVLDKVAELLEENSAADICRYANNIKRRMLIKGDSFVHSVVNEVGVFSLNKKSKGMVCVLAKEELGDAISVREIGALVGLSSSGVQHHLAKHKS